MRFKYLTTSQSGLLVITCVGLATDSRERQIVSSVGSPHSLINQWKGTVKEARVFKVFLMLTIKLSLEFAFPVNALHQGISQIYLFSYSICFIKCVCLWSFPCLSICNGLYQFEEALWWNWTTWAITKSHYKLLQTKTDWCFFSLFEHRTGMVVRLLTMGMPTELICHYVVWYILQFFCLLAYYIA